VFKGRFFRFLKKPIDEASILSIIDSMLLWIFIIIAWIAFVLFVCRLLGLNAEQERFIEEQQRKKENK
jgi:K+ transporter